MIGSIYNGNGVTIDRKDDGHSIIFSEFGNARFVVAL